MDIKKTITGETMADNHQILIEACKRGEVKLGACSPFSQAGFP